MANTGNPVMASEGLDAAAIVKAKGVPGAGVLYNQNAPYAQATRNAQRETRDQHHYRVKREIIFQDANNIVAALKLAGVKIVVDGKEASIFVPRPEVMYEASAVGVVNAKRAHWIATTVPVSGTGGLIKHILPKALVAAVAAVPGGNFIPDEVTTYVAETLGNYIEYKLDGGRPGVE